MMWVCSFFYCLCVGGECDVEILGVWGLRFVERRVGGD